MSLKRRFTSQPDSRNSVANQSSSSGWVGGCPCEPKSSLVLTMPVPNISCQYRLTVTRAIKGFDGSTSQRANPNRFLGYEAGKGGKAAGTLGSTCSRGWSYWP